MIEYLTGHILYCVLSTFLFIYFIHIISYYSIYIFFIYSFICMCIFPVYSYTFTGSSNSLDLYIQICDYLLLIRHLERIIGILRNLEFSLLDYWYSYLTFISIDSLFYIYITFSYHSITYSYDIMCGHLYVVLQ